MELTLPTKKEPKPRKKTVKEPIDEYFRDVKTGKRIVKNPKRQPGITVKRRKHVLQDNEGQEDFISGLICGLSSIII